MTYFLANHSMENFFINPTMTRDTSMETFARISMMGEPSSDARFDDHFSLSGSSKQEKARPVSTIQDLFVTNHSMTSYHSEEERASSRASSDSASLQLDHGDALEAALAELEAEKDEEPSAADLFLVPEELANSCAKIEQRCNRAQAVVLKPVGRPKVVSMPKLVDTGSRHHKSRSIESFTSGRVPQSLRREESRKSIRSTTSTKLSVEHSEPVPALPVSMLPTPIEEDIGSKPRTLKETPMRHPSVPLMKAASAFDAFPRLSDIAAGKDTPIKRSTTVSGVPEWIAADGSAVSPARRRLNRIASSLNNASDLIRRKSSVSSLRKSTTSATPSPRLSLVFDKNGPSTPMGPIPQRRSSMGRLTPRGPTERAPILVLPPFQDDDEEDDDFGDASSDQALGKWDRPRARQATKIGKARPSIDDIVTRST